MRLFASRAEVVVLLANIVENAVPAARRRHGDGGEVTVVTTEQRGKAIVTIADNGATITLASAAANEASGASEAGDASATGTLARITLPHA